MPHQLPYLTCHPLCSPLLVIFISRGFKIRLIKSLATISVSPFTFVNHGCNSRRRLPERNSGHHAEEDASQGVFSTVSARLTTALFPSFCKQRKGQEGCEILFGTLPKTTRAPLPLDCAVLINTAACKTRFECFQPPPYSNHHIATNRARKKKEEKQSIER